MAGGFARELERIEGYWKKHPLKRAYGLWVGLVVIFFVIAMLPMELNLGAESYRYVGSHSGPAGELWTLEREGDGGRVWRESRPLEQSTALEQSNAAEKGSLPEEQWIVTDDGGAHQALSNVFLMAYSSGVGVDEENAEALWSGNQSEGEGRTYSPMELQQMENFGRRSASRVSRGVQLLIAAVIGLLPVYLVVYPEKSLETLRALRARIPFGRSKGKSAGKKAEKRMNITAWVLLCIVIFVEYLIVA